MSEMSNGEIEVIQPQIEKPVGNGVEMDQSRPRETIVAEMDILAARREEFEERDTAWGEKAESLPEDQQDVLGEAEENDWQVDEDILKSYPPEVVSLIREAKSLVDESEGMSADEKKLKGEMVPYKKEEFEESRRKFLSQIDYSAMLDYYRNLPWEQAIEFNDSLVNSLSNLCEIKKIKDSPYDIYPYMIFDSYKRHSDYLNKTIEDFTNKRFITSGVEDITDKTESVKKEDIVTRKTEILDRLSGILTQLDEYSRLEYLYHSGIFFKTSDASLKSINFTLEELRFDDLDMGFFESLSQHIDKVVAEHRKNRRLPMTDEDKKEERVRIESLVPSEIEMIGFDPSDGMKLSLSLHEIDLISKSLLPLDVLNKVRTLTCKSGPGTTVDLISNVIVETAGLNSPVFEGANSVGSNIELYKHFLIPETIEDKELQTERIIASAVLIHEFAHTAHQSMNFDEMNSWEKVIESDQTPVTTYVSRSRDKDLRVGKREDFAETFQMFLNNPALLQIISPGRFMFMVNYFDGRLQEKQKPTFVNYLRQQIVGQQSIWTEGGYTAEQIKTNYLGE